MEAVEAQCFIQMPDQKNLRINNQTPDCAADGAGVAASAAKARRAAPVRGIAESLGTRDALHGIRCSRVALCRAPTNPRACAQPRLGTVASILVAGLVTVLGSRRWDGGPGRHRRHGRSSARIGIGCAISPVRAGQGQGVKIAFPSGPKECQALLRCGLRFDEKREVWWELARSFLGNRGPLESSCQATSERHRGASASFHGKLQAHLK